MPLPVWGFIVGISIGFMTSPKPSLALMCGGFLALLAWAITGFSIGEKKEEKHTPYNPVINKPGLNLEQQESNELKNNKTLNNNDNQISFSDKLWLVAGGLFVSAMFIGFVRLMFIEGPEAAFDKVPGPSLIFIIVMIIGWFVMAAFLQNKGATSLGKLMWSIGVFIILSFLLSVILSKCGVDFGGGEFKPPRSL